jgi:hypothetical protein
MPPGLGELLGKKMLRVCNCIRKKMEEPASRLRKKMGEPASRRLFRWLARPSCLGKLLEEGGGCIDARLDDPRIRPFLM